MALCISRYIPTVRLIWHKCTPILHYIGTTEYALYEHHSRQIIYLMVLLSSSFYLSVDCVCALLRIKLLMSKCLTQWASTSSTLFMRRFYSSHLFIAIKYKMHLWLLWFAHFHRCIFFFSRFFLPLYISFVFPFDPCAVVWLVAVISFGVVWPCKLQWTYSTATIFLYLSKAMFLVSSLP